MRKCHCEPGVKAQFTLLGLCRVKQSLNLPGGCFVAKNVPRSDKFLSCESPAFHFKAKVSTLKQNPRSRRGFLFMPLGGQKWARQDWRLRPNGDRYLLPITADGPPANILHYRVIAVRIPMPQAVRCALCWAQIDIFLYQCP